MALLKETGFVLLIESSEKSEIVDVMKNLLNRIDAIFLKQQALIQRGIRIIGEIKNFIQERNLYKPIIVDTRTDHFDLEYVGQLSNLLKKEGAYGMTIWCPDNLNFVKSCKTKAKIALFAIIDVGTPSFRDLFSNQRVIQSAIAAKNSNYEGAIMTTRNPDRIKEVREATGKDFRILSIVDEGTKIGNGISAGSDFEIVSPKILQESP